MPALFDNLMYDCCKLSKKETTALKVVRHYINNQIKRQISLKYDTWKYMIISCGKDAIWHLQSSEHGYRMTHLHGSEHSLLACMWTQTDDLSIPYHAYCLRNHSIMYVSHAHYQFKIHIIHLGHLMLTDIRYIGIGVRAWITHCMHVKHWDKIT